MRQLNKAALKYSDNNNIIILLSDNLTALSISVYTIKGVHIKGHYTTIKLYAIKYSMSTIELCTIS